MKRSTFAAIAAAAILLLSILFIIKERQLLDNGASVQNIIRMRRITRLVVSCRAPRWTPSSASNGDICRLLIDNHISGFETINPITGLTDKTVIVDPWGHPYKFILIEGHQISMGSSGPNGAWEFGAGDDVIYDGLRFYGNKIPRGANDD